MTDMKNNDIGSRALKIAFLMAILEIVFTIIMYLVGSSLTDPGVIAVISITLEFAKISLLVYLVLIEVTDMIRKAATH